MKPSNDLTRLSDLEGALGDAFRSAQSDTPSPGAKAALLATLGAGAAIATTTAASASAGAAGAASGAGAAGAGAVAKTSAGFFAAKWIVVSALAVGGAATTYAVHEAIQTPVTAPASTSEPRPTAVLAPRTPVVAPSSTPVAAAVVETESEPVPTAPAPVALAASAPAIVATNVRPTVQAPPEPTPSAPRTAAPIPTPEPILDAPAPPAKPASAVGEEITMLDEARREMTAGRSSNALAVLGRYNTRFPHGVMSEEARVLEIEALARSGQSARARELGASFIASHPSSPLVSRVRRAVDLP